MKTRKLSYQRRKALYGYGFLLLWMIGTVKWFLIPLCKSLLYSFSSVQPDTGGMKTQWIGFENYRYAFMSDQSFRTCLATALEQTLKQTPLILIFSLFIAVILNQKFRGRVFARAVFFLPVIIATGPVYSIISGNIDTSGSSSAAQFSTMFRADMVTDLMDFLGVYSISEKLTDTVRAVIDNVFGLVWASGIQILLFLAALQNIPPSAREAAQIEGATAWEYFWKIILPYVSPVVLANLIFTIIDAFANPTNPVMNRILSVQFDWQYGHAAAMAWSYFAIVLLALGIVVALVNRVVYYEVE